ncbi:hypothetical protein MRB53_033163 [Persea americana]|uniref:Uncharacterized protein n=1 Tax=Persea americana TaxID=3435 RepID=A0ACC2KU41_PERAE|nr:hypothetical protein MRB53_033163 [Persea americana]
MALLSFKSDEITKNDLIWLMVLLSQFENSSSPLMGKMDRYDATKRRLLPLSSRPPTIFDLGRCIGWKLSPSSPPEQRNSLYLVRWGDVRIPAATPPNEATIWPCRVFQSSHNSLRNACIGSKSNSNLVFPITARFLCSAFSNRNFASSAEEKSSEEGKGGDVERRPISDVSGGSRFSTETMSLGIKEPVYEVIEVRPNGIMTTKRINRRQLLKLSGLRLRDIRSVDPSLWLTNSMPSLLVELGSRAGSLKQMLLDILEDPHEIRRICVMGKNCTVQKVTNDLECAVPIEKQIAEEEEEEIEMLLENYLERCESCHGQAERLLDSAREMEDSIAVNLSSRRLEVSRVELLLQVGTFCVAVGALVAGIFGMNLKSYLEEHVLAFWMTTAGIIVGGVAAFFLMYSYLRERKIL